MRNKKRAFGFWRKFDKALADIIKEKKKTLKANEKIYRKAAGERRKRVEKRIDRILVVTGVFICLLTVFADVKSEFKNRRRTKLCGGSIKAAEG